MSKKKNQELISQSERDRRHKEEEAAKRAREKKRKARKRTIRVLDDPPVETSRPAAVKKPALAPPQPEAQRSLKSQQSHNTPPTTVSANSRLLKLWETCTDDERDVAAMLCSLQARMANVGITSYFQFGEEWERRYQRQDNRGYKRGEQAVKNAATLSGISASKVYQVLTTLRVYNRAQYTEMADKAEKNGITIIWTQLRIIAWRLGKSDYRAIRRKVEQEIVKRRMTEAQLNQMIDELAPDTKSTREGQEVKKSGKSQVAGIISGWGKNAKQYKAWMKALEKWEQDLQVDNQEEVEKTLAQISMILQFTEQTREFSDQVHDLISTMQCTVAFLADNGENASQKNKCVNTAKGISERVKAEKDHEKTKRAEREKLQLASGFTDSDDDDFNTTPCAHLRDGDDFPDEQEGDEDEFPNIDNDDNIEETEYGDDESQEWEDAEDADDANDEEEDDDDLEEEEVDENDQDIFDEAGNIN